MGNNLIFLFFHLQLSEKGGAIMYRRNFINKLVELLKVNEVSAYKLSKDLKKSKNYINNIIHNNHMPSIDEFLNICDYFHITPNVFFDDESIRFRSDVLKIAEKISCLEGDDLDLVESFIDRIIGSRVQLHNTMVYIDNENDVEHQDALKVAEGDFHD